MIGKFLIGLGTWFEKHFPEKVSTGEVYAKIAALELRLHAVTEFQTQLEEVTRAHNALASGVTDLTKKIDVLSSENTALKAASALRVRASIPMPGR